MTHNLEAVKALNAEAIELGNSLVAPIIERGFKDMSEEETNRVIGILTATIEMTEATLAWANGDRSYESWLEMYTKANNNKVYMDLDPSGRLAALSKAVLQLDMRDYFEAEVKNLEINVIDATLTIDMTKKVIELIKAGTIDDNLA